MPKLMHILKTWERYFHSIARDTAHNSSEIFLLYLYAVSPVFKMVKLINSHTLPLLKGENMKQLTRS